MTDKKIKCPSCSFEFELSNVLSEQIRNDMKLELQEELNKEKELLLEKQKNISDLEESLKAKEKDIDLQIAEQLKTKESQLKKTIEDNLKKNMDVELQDLKNQIGEKDEKIKQAQEQELELRKKSRELEDKQKNYEIEMARKLDEERNKIKLEAAKEIDEQHRLKDLEKDKKIQDLTKSIDEWKRKAEQGSMETQGEVLEQNIENTFKAEFPLDVIEPVPKGIAGADLIHTVNTQLGRKSGILLWEIKNTKAWSDKWIDKLKDDQRTVGADIAIIATIAMPNGIESFGYLNGVVVVSSRLIMPVAHLLRKQINEVNFAKMALEGKNEKVDLLYRYLTGPEFKQKIEGIVESFSGMQDQLNKEKRAMNKIWKEREKLIDRMMTNTSGLYGDMRGIIGSSIPQIRSLELADDDLEQPEVAQLPSSDSNISNSTEDDYE